MGLRTLTQRVGCAGSPVLRLLTTADYVQNGVQHYVLLLWRILMKTAILRIYARKGH